MSEEPKGIRVGVEVSKGDPRLLLLLNAALSTLAFAGIVAVAYAQLVRSAPPVDAGPLPPRPRFERLLYAALGLGVVLVGLTVPLL